MTAANKADIVVRRAKRTDAPAIATVIAAASGRRLTPTPEEALEWLYTKGYWVALQGDAVVGVVGWQAENLIASIEDFYLAPIGHWQQVAEALLKTIEQEANLLSCEVALLGLPQGTPEPLVAFLAEHGYQVQPLDDLIRAWREAAEEFVDETMILLVKKLRERRIMRPL